MNKQGRWKLILGALFLLGGISQGPDGLVGGLVLGAIFFILWYIPAKKAKRNAANVAQPTMPPETVEKPVVREPARPEPTKEELNFNRQTLSSKKALTSFDTYIVLDLETTGLSARYDEIIEVAMIKYVKGKEIARLHSLVRPSISLPKKITQITGLTNADLRGAPQIDEITPQMWSFIQGYTLVGYNVSFDLGFIKAALERAGYSGDFDCVDVLPMARKAYPDMPNHKLATLIDELDLADEQTHRATDDVICTQQLLTLCLGILLEQREKELAAKRAAKNAALTH